MTVVLTLMVSPPDGGIVNASAFSTFTGSSLTINLTRALVSSMNVLPLRPSLADRIQAGDRDIVTPGLWKAPHEAGLSVQLDVAWAPYIIPSIPPMPPGGIAGPLSFFGFSATVASVVISNPAIDAAFCSAARTTFVGSRIPIFTKSPYSSV